MCFTHLTVDGLITASGTGANFLTYNASSQFGGASGSASSPTTANTNILLYNNSSTNWAGIGADTGGNMYFVTGTSSPATHLYVSAGGVVGIGTTSPAYTLDVTGSIRSTVGYYNSSGGVRRGKLHL